MRIFLRFALLLFAAAGLACGAGAPRQAAAQVNVGVSITVPPPVLPVYSQPVIPGPGYIWAPGYWAWGPYGYYWVPGTWVLPPAVGLLWTPGYWAWNDGVYFWHAGYWGPRVGFYGGIVYGYGYDGIGYHGGFWQGGHFHYNTVVNNIGSVHVAYVYRRTVVNNVNITRVSFNGGHGGIAARPTAQQQAFATEHHVGETPVQRQHDDAARGREDLRSSFNHGRPPIAATPRATAFTGRGVTGPGAAGPAPHAAPSRNAAPNTNNGPPRNMPVHNAAPNTNNGPPR
ncbi:MAG TPA: YXWGXW repeat-containing protein, partial [Stellaceae bacterium]|nr:YXWGXW repeat-containing protein [Stellaceae bacterium]